MRDIDVNGYIFSGDVAADELDTVITPDNLKQMDIREDTGGVLNFFMFNSLYTLKVTPENIRQLQSGNTIKVKAYRVPRADL